MAQHRQPKRAAHGKRAVQAHADQRQHPAGARRPHQPDAPADHANDSKALPQTDEQAAEDQHGVAGRHGQCGPRGHQANQAGQGIDQEPAQHAGFAAQPVCETAGVTARQNGRQKGDADGKPGPRAIQAEPVDDIDRHGRHRHGDGKIG